MSVQIVLSDDDVGVKGPKRKAHDKSMGKDKKSSIFIPDGDYGDEVIFVNPEHYSPRKKMKQDEEKRTAAIDNSSVGTDSEIAVTFAKKGIDFPHAREHCRIQKFVQDPSTTTRHASNEEFCEKCYCYVCDDLASKCESWKTGEDAHCNAYEKHAFWENERRMHKRNTRMKKFRFVPILTLLAPQKINQDMRKAAISCNKYVDEMKEASDSSYDMMTRKACGCFCHQDSYLVQFACPTCEWQHMLTQYSGDNGSYGRAMDKVRMLVSNSITLVESSFKSKQPNSAILILDTITSLLLGVDINSPHSKYLYERDSSRIVSLWIEAALDKGLDKDLLSKAKERLSKSVKDNQNHLFLPEAKKIHRILSELRPYDDPLVVKSLTKRHKGGLCGLKEPYEVAKLRLQNLRSNNKFSEAINYILGAETVEANHLQTHRVCDYLEQRNELVDLLITKERMQEALAVCVTHISEKLPTDLGKKGKTGKSFNMHWTPIKSMSLKTFKILFNGLVKSKASGLSEEGLKKAMTITLPGIYSNAYLSSLEFFEFLLDKIGAQNKNYEYPSEAVRKDARQSASSFLDTKVKKGYNQFQPEDIMAPRNVPLTVYLIEIIVQVVSTRYSVLKCLQSLVKKGLYWACETLIFAPRVQGTMQDIQPSEVSYFSKTILPHCGPIPLDHFKIWFTNIHAVAYFQVLFNLVSDMFNAGSKKKGPEGVTLKKNAMLLSQTLMESVLINCYGRDRSVIEKHFKTVQEKFPSEAAKKLGIPVITWGPLEMEFMFKPNFKALEAIRNSMGSQNKVEFIKKREILIKFLKKNSRFLQEAVIEIFIQLEMYKDLLECLSGMTAGYNGYESSFSKINTSLEEAKRMGDKTKTMALVEALKDYVATALVQASFSYSFRQHTKPIPRQVSECVKLIHSISQVLFMSIIKKAIDEVTEKYLSNTVIQQKRTELGKWLLEIKAIFTSVKENSEWTVVFSGILQGPLKRKHQIIMCLQSNRDLF